MKFPRHRSLALLAAVAITGCGQISPAASSSASASVVASGPGVALNVPEGWTDVSQREFAVAKLNPGVEGVIDLQLNGDSKQYLFILRQPAAAFASPAQSPPTLAQIAAIHFRQEAQAFGCNGPTNQTQRALAGSPDMSADFDCSKTQRQERMVVVLNGSYVYLLYFVVASSSFTNDISVLNGILGSWRWLSSSAAGAYEILTL
jgi:hypothetical protein